MRTLAVVAATVLMAAPAAAQQWSAEQLEVWNAEVACLNAGIDDISARKACVHPDFMGWGVQGPVPKGWSDADADYYFAHNTLKTVAAMPLHILVEGDIAIIQLVVTTMSSLDDGPDEESWIAWTDIMRKDGGVWRWIADHGHVLGTPN